MKFSVVVPTYNRIPTLRQTLTALVAQTYPDHEIIVVDDGSTDGTAVIVEREFRSVRLIRQSNRGPAAARNRGIQESTGEIVAFTDDDCVPPPDWLARLDDGYARYPQVAGVGGYLEAPDDALATNPFARFEHYVSHRVYGAGDRDVLGGFECPAGGTNSMSYRRAILLAVGGFDETFPYAAGEDADVKWRICQKGHLLLYVPARVIHLQPYTRAAFRQQYITHGRGAIHFERKHTHVPSRRRVLLRAVKRSLRFLPDAVSIGPTLAGVKLLAGLYEVRGQWQEIKRRRDIRR